MAVYTDTPLTTLELLPVDEEEDVTTDHCQFDLSSPYRAPANKRTSAKRKRASVTPQVPNQFEYSEVKSEPETIQEPETSPVFSEAIQKPVPCFIFANDSVQHFHGHELIDCSGPVELVPSSNNTVYPSRAQDAANTSFDVQTEPEAIMEDTKVDLVQTLNPNNTCVNCGKVVKYFWHHLKKKECKQAYEKLNLLPKMSNKEVIRNYRRQYYEANKARLLAIQKVYDTKNRATRAAIKRTYRKRSSKGKHTLSVCINCGKKCNYILKHLTRKSECKQVYEQKNVLPLKVIDKPKKKKQKKPLSVCINCGRACIHIKMHLMKKLDCKQVYVERGDLPIECLY